MTNKPLLSIEDLHVYRSESHILEGITLQVHQGECVSIIGSNGAGKTTLVESILGILRPRSGKVLLDNVNISRLKTHELLNKGIAWAPEGRRLFSDMTVKENIFLGCQETISIDAFEELLLLFPILKLREDQHAGTLSGGEQQMVALARAMISKPRLLIIDEMSIGLSPKLTKEVFKALEQIRLSGVSILLVEQNAFLALRHSDRAYVLEQGQIKMEGPSKTLINSPEIKNAYLGSSYVR